MFEAHRLLGHFLVFSYTPFLYFFFSFPWHFLLALVYLRRLLPRGRHPCGTQLWRVVVPGVAFTRSLEWLENTGSRKKWFPSHGNSRRGIRHWFLFLRAFKDLSGNSVPFHNTLAPVLYFVVVYYAPLFLIFWFLKSTYNLEFKLISVICVVNMNTQ